MVEMDDLSRIDLKDEIVKSLGFIAGYADHSYLKSTSKCEVCLNFLLFSVFNRFFTRNTSPTIPYTN